MKKKSKTLITFYFLVLYIALQFVWWTYLLSSLTFEVSGQKEESLRIQFSSEEIFKSALVELKQKQKRKIIMIATEGAVFLSLLLFGIYRVKKSLDKENETVEHQKNFMLSVTHELKTPLAAIKLNLQTMRKRELNKEQQERMLEIAEIESERLNNLIENILVASRLENAEVKFHPERINLSDYITEFIALNFRSERIQFEGEFNVWVMVDKNMVLPSIISNLIENALKYSQDKVIISLLSDKSIVKLCVADNGIGIPDSEKDRIFNKFYRVGSEETRNTKGTGLGLFIVKYIADICNYKIEVLNNSPNGSRFIVHLPACD